MEPIDVELKNAFARQDPIPAAESAAIKHRIIEAFARKQKSVFSLMTVYLVALVLVIIALIALFISTPNIKDCLLYGIGILIMFESTVLMKLWYWVMHSKIATVREIKLVQLSIAELKARLSTEEPGPSSALPQENRPEPPQAPAAPAPSTSWWTILSIVWLLAVSGCIYLGWLNTLTEPRGVTPFYERTIAAEEPEWQGSFEVTKGRARFYPQLMTPEKDSRVWISVAQEGREPMYAGSLECGARISFGHAGPGRYVVRGRNEWAHGSLVFRIGGVDEITGQPPFGRILLLMLSAALTVVIPIAWLQHRWSRRADLA